MQVFEKFSEHKVQFVSITAHDKLTVEQFVDEFSIRWPCGYGVEPDHLVALRAYSTDMGEGYEVKPTLYLLSSQGKVLWTDNRRRMGHQDPQIAIDELTAALEKELGEM